MEQLKMYLTESNVENIQDGIEICIPVMFRGEYIQVVINKCSCEECND